VQIPGNELIGEAEGWNGAEAAEAYEIAPYRPYPWNPLLLESDHHHRAAISGLLLSLATDVFIFWPVRPFIYPSHRRI
jgi:hypothetical protein